jgi:hypothetical protein
MPDSIQYASIDDLIAVEPTIQDYGILEYDDALQQSTSDIKRYLRIRWWPSYVKYGRLDLRFVGAFIQMEPAKLDPTQFVKATVYHALHFYILPRLTKFEPNLDRFQVMMEFYRKRFEDEMDLCIRDGVHYDDNANGIFEPVEETPTEYLKLRR